VVQQHVFYTEECGDQALIKLSLICVDFSEIHEQLVSIKQQIKQYNVQSNITHGHPTPLQHDNCYYGLFIIETNAFIDHIL